MSETSPAVVPAAVDCQALAADWLARFERALAAADRAALAALFEVGAYWRDVLALSWRIETVHGAEAIAGALLEATAAGPTRPTGLRLDTGRTAPRVVTRAGRTSVEAIFAFDTGQGRGSGVLRLRRPDDATDATDATAEPRAWTFLTSLDALRGFEERIDRTRPKGQAYSRDFRGPNWLDQRRAESAYADRDPAVLVVGGGQAGLAVAARLRQLQVDTLIVDRGRRVGDNWRNRYHALTLHNQVQVNHLPYMPFPPTWPTYIPKDKLAGWLEAYVESMELNVWTGTEFLGGEYDERDGRWTVTLRGPEGERRLRPRHVVLATGVSGIPNLPEIPTLARFAGRCLHSGQYRDGEDWSGRRALVIGTGNSGHDIAQDLYASGARVTLVQRSPTLVVNIEPSAQLPYALYDEGPSLQDCDLITMSMPFALTRVSHRRFTARARELDRELLERLENVGFRLDFGADDTGWQFKYLTRGGGYYFNVGCSDLIADGSIGLLQYDAIEAFAADGARLRDGAAVPADLIVLATGYQGQECLVRELFGEAVAGRVGPIWGFEGESERQELRNMYCRTGQPGLWFIAGSLAQCRIYSKPLALQIRALEAGLLD